MPISEMEGYFDNPLYRYLEEPMLFCWLENETSNKKRFLLLKVH